MCAWSQRDTFLHGLHSYKRATCANQKCVHHQTSNSHKLPEINDDEYWTHTKYVVTKHCIIQEIDSQKMILKN